jgi:glycosyltransferase involved in cell wall biosynthesis
MLYFCIPTHNEAPTVGLLCWKIRRVLEETSREYQLIVGDDASTDDTRQVLAAYAKALPLTVLRSETRLGYAATVERVLKEALRMSDRHKRDSVILVPADFTFDLAELPEFLKRIDSGADIVVGEATVVGETDPWRRRVRQWAPRLLGRRARVPGVRDVVSGVMAFRLVTLRAAFRDRPERWLTTEDWAANAELLSWAAAGARQIESVRITERVERRQRESRHAAWDRAKALWAARRMLVAPTFTPEAPRKDRSPRAATTRDAA